MAKKKTFSFAHLIGLGPSASEEEEDKGDDEDDADAVGVLFRREDVERQRGAVLAAVDDILLAREGGFIGQGHGGGE